MATERSALVAAREFVADAEWTEAARLWQRDVLAKIDAALAEAPVDRLWVNAERTVLVRLWANGTVEVATRSEPDAIWGPPVYLKEES